MTLPYKLYQVSIKLCNDQQTHFHPLFIGLPDWVEIEKSLSLEIAILAESGSETTVRRDNLKSVYEFIRVSQDLKADLAHCAVGEPARWCTIRIAGVDIGTLSCQEVPAYLVSGMKLQVSDAKNNRSQPSE
jgi:hypothetical protein